MRITRNLTCWCMTPFISVLATLALHSLETKKVDPSAVSILCQPEPDDDVSAALRTVSRNPHPDERERGRADPPSLRHGMRLSTIRATFLVCVVVLVALAFAFNSQLLQGSLWCDHGPARGAGALPRKIATW